MWRIKGPNIKSASPTLLLLHRLTESNLSKAVQVTKHRVEPENAVLLEMNWLQSECIKQSHLNYFDGIRGLFSVLSAWLGWKQFPELTHTHNYPGSWNTYEVFSWIVYQMMCLGKTLCKFLTLNTSATVLYGRLCRKKRKKKPISVDEYINIPLEWDSDRFSKQELSKVKLLHSLMASEITLSCCPLYISMLMMLMKRKSVKN